MTPTPAGSAGERSGTSAQNVEDEVVLDLRSGWLLDVETNPERHSPKPVTRGMKLRRDFEEIVDEFVYWLDRVNELVLRTITPRERHRDVREITIMQRERKAEEASRLVSTVFVIAAAFATLVYVAIQAHVLDLRRISEILDH